MILPVLLPLVRYSGVEEVIEFNGLMMSVLGVDRSKMQIFVSFLVTLYMLPSLVIGVVC